MFTEDEIRTLEDAIIILRNIHLKPWVKGDGITDWLRGRTSASADIAWSAVHQALLNNNSLAKSIAKSTGSVA